MKKETIFENRTRITGRWEILKPIATFLTEMWPETNLKNKSPLTITDDEISFSETNWVMPLHVWGDFIRGNPELFFTVTHTVTHVGGKVAPASYSLYFGDERFLRGEFQLYNTDDNPPQNLPTKSEVDEYGTVRTFIPLISEVEKLRHEGLSLRDIFSSNRKDGTPHLWQFGGDRLDFVEPDPEDEEEDELLPLDGALFFPKKVADGVVTDSAEGIGDLESALTFARTNGYDVVEARQGASSDEPLSGTFVMSFNPTPLS